MRPDALIVSQSQHTPVLPIEERMPKLVTRARNSAEASEARLSSGPW